MQTRKSLQDSNFIEHFMLFFFLSFLFFIFKSHFIEAKTKIKAVQQLYLPASKQNETCFSKKIKIKNKNKNRMRHIAIITREIYFKSLRDIW